MSFQICQFSKSTNLDYYVLTGYIVSIQSDRLTTDSVLFGTECQLISNQQY